MGVLDGVLGGFLSGAGAAASSWMNWQSQKETNAQNLALTQEQWGREDTAVQRRAADMTAAGINPLMAAGSPAVSSPAARMEAPQVSSNVGLAAVQGAAAAASVAQTAAQTELTHQQARKASAEADAAAGTAGYTVDRSRMENVYLAETLDGRIQKTLSDADAASQAAYLAEINKRVAASLAGLDKPEMVNGVKVVGYDGGAPDSLAVQMERARVQSLNAGSSKMAAETAALARAVVSSRLDASALEKLGVSPWVIDLVMKAVQTIGQAVR